MKRFLAKNAVLLLWLLLCVMPASAMDLLQAYESARTHDPEYRAALLKLKGDLLVLDISRARYKPTITLTDRVARNRYESNQLDVANLDVAGCLDVNCVISRVNQLNRQGTESNYTSQQASLLLTQPLYDATLLAENKKADAFVEQAKQNYLMAEQDLLIRVSSAYFSMMQAQQTLLVLQQQTKSLQQLQAIVERRQAQGLSKAQESYEALSYQQKQTLALMTAQSAFASSMQRLSQLVGVEVGSVKSLPTISQSHLLPARTVEEWQTIAKANNNAIQSAKALEQVSYFEMKARKGAYWPKFTFAASYMDDQFSGGRGFSPEATTMAAGIEMKWPLYQGGGVTAASKQAAYRYEEAKEHSRHALSQLDGAVLALWQALEMDAKRYEMAEALHESATKVERVSERSYQQGTATLLRLLEARQQTIQAQQSVVVVNMDVLEHSLSLLRMTGELSAKHLQDINALLKEPMTVN